MVFPCDGSYIFLPKSCQLWLSSRVIPRIIVIKITLRLDITSSCSRVNETLIYETMIVLRFSVTVNNYSVLSGLRHRFPDRNYQFLNQGCKPDLWGSNSGPIDFGSDVVLLRQHVSLCVIKFIEIKTRRMATNRVQSWSVILGWSHHFHGTFQ